MPCWSYFLSQFVYFHSSACFVCRRSRSGYHPLTVSEFTNSPICLYAEWDYHPYNLFLLLVFFFAKRFQVNCCQLGRSSPTSYLNSSHPLECYRELLAALMDSLLLKFPLWTSPSARFDVVAWKWCLWMFSCWISPSPQVPPRLPLSSQEPKCPSQDLLHPCMEVSNREVIEVMVGIGRWLIPILLNFFSLCVWWSSSYSCSLI